MLKYLVGKMAKNSFENYPFCFIQTTEPIVPRHSHDGINVEKIAQGIDQVQFMAVARLGASCNNSFIIS